MKHGSLFSGIGGFDLAAQWMGWDNVFHCEWNPFGQKVLKYYWPEAISYEDITKTDFSIHRGNIDVLTGGFPCQPYSTAGLRKGKEDERHLWPEMLRAIREIQPRWVVGENVLGLVSWNGGLVFEEVQVDLEAEGFQVQPYVLPAAGVDAPHRRDRIWFVAYSSGNGHKSRGFGEDRCQESEGACIQKERERIWEDIRGISEHKVASDTERNGLQWSNKLKEINSSGVQEGLAKRYEFDALHGAGVITNSDYYRKRCGIEGKPWSNFPTQPPVCDGDDGISARLDGITFSKWRTESIKAGGNAIVPQVVYQIFKAIELYEQTLKL